MQLTPEIKTERPPIWDEAHKHFEIDDKHTIYAYGDTIYNPGHAKIDKHIIAHESTHLVQQAGMGVEAWWKRYFEDPKFRFEQELEAYRKQYQSFIQDNPSRDRRFRYVWQIAGFLAGGTYGNLVSQRTALDLIKEKKDA